MCQEEINKIKKVNQSRKHKINNSLGVYDAYKWIRKNKWLNIGQPITEKQFYSIIRSVNKNVVKDLLLSKDIILPNRMGKLELRKRIPKIDFIDGKIKTNLPVDWNRTLNLWVEDQQAKKDKILIRHESKCIFKVLYNKHNATFNNKSFYTFTLNREVKKELKNKIINNQIDAYLL